jgi:hypothetical protein
MSQVENHLLLTLEIYKNFILGNLFFEKYDISINPIPLPFDKHIPSFKKNM